MGALALVASSAIYEFLLARLRRFEAARAGAAPWWLGYARDGANVLGAALYAASLALVGLSGPPSLALGVGLLLLTYGADWALGKHLAWRAAPLLAVAATAAAAAPACLSPARADAALRALLVITSGG